MLARFRTNILPSTASASAAAAQTPRFRSSAVSATRSRPRPGTNSSVRSFATFPRSTHVQDFVSRPPPEFRIVSGIQPTGNLHLGNYLGAIQPWVQLQSALRPGSPSNQILYSIVDLHALTVPKAARNLSESCFDLATVLLACGVDPKRCVLFYQSQVPQITQLTWILGCTTPMGWLNRMTQFKQKKIQAESQFGSNSVGVGLFHYPVLMAADILMFNASHVPVGDDQAQHLELCRSVADTFNYTFKAPDCFRLPHAIHSTATRVMSLTDGRAKMSKSAISDKSRIHLIDTDDEIQRKVSRAKSDSVGDITWDPENRPEISNLMRIYAALRDVSIEATIAEFEGKNARQLKKSTADVIVEHIAPIRGEILRLRDDPVYVNTIMKQGGEKAREMAESNWERIVEVVGLPPRI